MAHSHDASTVQTCYGMKLTIIVARGNLNLRAASYAMPHVQMTVCYLIGRLGHSAHTPVGRGVALRPELDG